MCYILLIVVEAHKHFTFYFNLICERKRERLNQSSNDWIKKGILNFIFFVILRIVSVKQQQRLWERKKRVREKYLMIDDYIPILWTIFKIIIKVIFPLVSRYKELTKYFQVLWVILENAGWEMLLRVDPQTKKKWAWLLSNLNSYIFFVWCCVSF